MCEPHTDRSFRWRWCLVLPLLFSTACSHSQVNYLGHCSLHHWGIFCFSSNFLYECCECNFSTSFSGGIRCCLWDGPFPGVQAGVGGVRVRQMKPEKPDQHNCERRYYSLSSFCWSVEEMAAATVSVEQDQFSCSVCLDVLTDPVTIPCGHSYCLDCIDGHWNTTKQKGQYSCPQCRQVFNPRPLLSRNTLLAEVVEHGFREADWKLQPKLWPNGMKWNAAFARAERAKLWNPAWSALSHTARLTWVSTKNAFMERLIKWSRLRTSWERRCSHQLRRRRRLCWWQMRKQNNRYVLKLLCHAFWFKGVRICLWSLILLLRSEFTLF